MRMQSIEALCTLFILISLVAKNFTAVKINEAVGKRICKASKIRYVFRNEQYNLHCIERELITYRVL